MIELARYAVPARITMALDAKGLDGPEVDVACGAREPDVDLWEAGVRLPTREQVGLLAKLTGQVPVFFYELEASPVGRVFICDRSRRGKNALTVVEPGEGANPVCPGCGVVAWAVMGSADGPVLIDRPDLYGSMVVTLLKKATRGRPQVWGVRPIGAGEKTGVELRRRPHECRVLTLACTVPVQVPQGAVCGVLGNPYPEGVRCRPHSPGSRAAARAQARGPADL